MVPRTKIVAIAGDSNVVDALGVAISAGHRRLPVYRNDIDDVVGIIRLRDLAALARTQPEATAGSCVGHVLRAGSGDPISDLLHRMQVTGRWLAVVTDADGRTLGLATIEDVVASWSARSPTSETRRIRAIDRLAMSRLLGLGRAGLGTRTQHRNDGLV